MSLWITGLGTALPEFTMSQQEAAELARSVCCHDAEQARLLPVLYRKAGVNNRYTVLPHRLALDWLPAAAAATTAGVSELGAIDDANGMCAAPAAAVAGANGANGHASHQPERKGHVASGTASTSVVGLGPTTAERMEFYEQLAWPLAERAARAALAESGVRADSITHLVTVSCTGFAAPGVDVALINRLGLRPTTERVNVGFMGCHGALNGLRAARAFTVADPQARVLLSAVELCSLHYRYQWDPERFIGNALFADGAAALVALGDAAQAEVAQRGGNASGDNASGLDAPWQVAATGSVLLPDSQDAMTWRLGNHGFEMTLSSRVPDLICRHLRPWLSEWLGKHGLTIDEVGSWAIHPGGPRILSAVEESLGLAAGATRVSREVLSECGNMSSPTVLFIFNRMRALSAARPIVMLGFGPGLMAEVALLR